MEQDGGLPGSTRVFEWVPALASLGLTGVDQSMHSGTSTDTRPNGPYQYVDGKSGAPETEL